MKCKSGKHEYIDLISVKRCCNGFTRCLVDRNRKDGFEPGGEAYPYGVPELKYVWIKEVENVQ